MVKTIVKANIYGKFITKYHWVLTHAKLLKIHDAPKVPTGLER